MSDQDKQAFTTFPPGRFVTPGVCAVCNKPMPEHGTPGLNAPGHYFKVTITQHLKPEGDMQHSRLSLREFCSPACLLTWVKEAKLEDMRPPEQG